MASSWSAVRISHGRVGIAAPRARGAAADGWGYRAAPLPPSSSSPWFHAFDDLGARPVRVCPNPTSADAVVRPLIKRWIRSSCPAPARREQKVRGFLLAAPPPVGGGAPPCAWARGGPGFLQPGRREYDIPPTGRLPCCLTTHEIASEHVHRPGPSVGRRQAAAHRRIDRPAHRWRGAGGDLGRADRR